MNNPMALLDDPSKLTTPRPLQWLARSKIMAVIWTTMRVWLGAVWIQAGAAKLWGAENPAFLHHNGAGVAGFATHGVAAYTWWGSFLHSFVVPNAAPIGVFIAVAEFAIGIALVLGLLYPPGVARQPGLALHLRHVGDGQRVRVLRPVRHRHPGHLEDLELARRRRVHRWLRPAPPRPPAIGLYGTAPKRGHGPRSGGVSDVRRPVLSWPERGLDRDRQIWPSEKVKVSPI